MSFINIEKKSEFYPQNVTCKRCGEKNLRWSKTLFTKSGWELLDKDSNKHYCNSVDTDYVQQPDFYNNYVIGNKKVNVWIPTEEEKKEMQENMKKYDAFYREHTFSA